jgi:TonB family protein
MIFRRVVGDGVGEAPERRYGFGLSREAHIAFATAYISILLTIGAFGVLRAVPLLAQYTPHWTTRPVAALPAYRARPLPDPAAPHRISLYPRIALLNRQEGTVVLRLLVLANGEVGDVSVIRSSGFPQLDATALVETGYWRYLPAVRNGQPVSAEVDVAIRFRLSDG